MHRGLMILCSSVSVQLTHQPYLLNALLSDRIKKFPRIIIIINLKVGHEGLFHFRGRLHNVAINRFYVSRKLEVVKEFTSSV
jgi:uncharacterized protein (UPF0303 family)